MKVTNLIAVAALAVLAACSSTQDTRSGSGSAGQTEAPPQAEPVQTGPAMDSVEYFNTEVGDRVFFAFDKFNLEPSAQATLRDQASWLNQNPSRTIVVEGHCDERGTREYNLALGERRANAVKEYLVSLGVSAGRIRTISYGKERPVCTQSNESCWSKNRRAVSVVN